MIKSLVLLYSENNEHVEDAFLILKNFIVLVRELILGLNMMNVSGLGDALQGE